MLGGDKAQRYPIIAPPLAGGGWAIVKQMALVTAALDAMIFGAGPNQFVIRLCCKMIWNAGKETWPASAAVILHFGAE